MAELTVKSTEEPSDEVHVPAHREFHLLVQAVKDYAIFLLDPEGRVVSWNAGARAIKGYDASEVIGRHYSMFYAAEDAERGLPQQYLASALRHGRFEGEGWRKRKDGRRFWANVVLTPLYDESGTHIGFAKITRDITERMRYEERLAEAQRIANLGSWDWDVANDRVTWSDQLFRIYGLRSEDFVPTYEGVLHYVHPDDREHFRRTLEKALEDREPFSFYHRIVRPDGQMRVLHARGSVMSDRDQVVRRVLGTGQDVTELRQAQEALEAAKAGLERRVEERTAELSRAYAELVRETAERKRAEEWFSITLRSIGDAVIAADPQGRIVFMNGVAETLTGYTQPEVLGQHLASVFRIVNEHTRHTVESPADKVLREGKVVGLANHTVLISKDGREVAIDDSGAPIRDEAGNVVGVVVVFHDVTERKRAENALRESEERFRLLADATPVMVWVSGIDKLKSFFNRSWLEFTGRNPDQELGEGWQYGVHPDDRPRALEIYSASFEARKDFEMEFRLRRFDGDYRWVLDKGTPRHLVDGSFAGYIGSCIDITEHRAERERQKFLSETSKTLTLSLDYTQMLGRLCQLIVPDMADWCAIDAIDEEGHPREVALLHKDPQQLAGLREAKQILAESNTGDWSVGYALARGEPQPRPLDPDDAARAVNNRAMAALRKLDTRSSIIVPMVARGRTLGTIAFGLVASSGRRYGTEDLALAEEVAYRAAVAVDNARLYDQAQAAIRARDEFLSIASHELRTPLTSMQLQLQTILHLVRRNPADPPALEKVASMVETGFRQGERLGRLVADLLDLSRIAAQKLTLEKEDLDLATVASDVVARMRPDFEQKKCAVALHVDRAAPGHWDRLRIEQVVTNLLANVIRYAAGKPVEIAVTPGIDRHTLTVRDEGPGMPAEFLPRIFRPLERAAPRDFGGLGLGLYIVRQIVEAHGGTVEVESRLGHGSTFTVVLPTGSDDGP